MQQVGFCFFTSFVLIYFVRKRISYFLFFTSFGLTYFVRKIISCMIERQNDDYIYFFILKRQIMESFELSPYLILIEWCYVVIITHLSTFKSNLKHQLLLLTFRCLHRRHPQQVQTERKTRKVKMALLPVGTKAKKMVSQNRPIHTLVSLLCL